MKFKPCVLETLASSSSCDLLRCSGCGTVHMHLRDVSLRLSEEQAIDVANTLNKALLHTETSLVGNSTDDLNHGIVN